MHVCTLIYHRLLFRDHHHQCCHLLQQLLERGACFETGFVRAAVEEEDQGNGEQLELIHKDPKGVWGDNSCEADAQGDIFDVWVKMSHEIHQN